MKERLLDEVAFKQTATGANRIIASLIPGQRSSMTKLEDIGNIFRAIEHNIETRRKIARLIDGA
eukprot:9048222-Pyramimonas_sp.AAC.1